MSDRNTRGAADCRRVEDDVRAAREDGTTTGSREDQADVVSQSEVFITQFIPPILKTGFCKPGSGPTPDASPPNRTFQTGNCPTTSPDEGVSR